MNFDEFLTTKMVAERLGLKEGKVLSEAKRHGVAPGRFGTLCVWEERHVLELKKRIQARKDGVCPHCGEKLAATDVVPRETPDPEPAE